MADQKKILIINTGGTFNKFYDPKSGELVVDQTSNVLEEIASKWLCDFEIMNIIGKDSRDMNSQDRLELLATIIESEYTHIVVIHGTDTMELSAEYLSDAEEEKSIVLTGAMVPYSIDPVEATANLASALGYLQNCETDGIYIAMNGFVGDYRKIRKDRKQAKFVV